MPQTAPRLLTKQRAKATTTTTTICNLHWVCECVRLIVCVCVCVQLKSVLTSIVDLHSDNVHNLRAIIRTTHWMGIQSIQYFHVVQIPTFRICLKLNVRFIFETNNCVITLNILLFLLAWILFP